MPRNYNTTQHLVFPRVPEIRISYPPNGIPKVRYIECMAIVDGNGHVQHTDAGHAEYALQLNQITESVQCVDPATGHAIPGMTVTKRQLMLALLAFIRADQKRRDAEADAASSAVDSIVDPE